MRITNSMINNHSKTNINATKVLKDYYNNQMTSQKKISKPSDDPVVAIRSLRLRNTLSETEQYYTNNISDAESWLENVDTALSNMNTILKNIRGYVEKGATDTLSAADRITTAKSLVNYMEQFYDEGNANYEGRTIFTGYRTDYSLSYLQDSDATYSITQNLSHDDIDTVSYFTNLVNVPDSAAEIATADDVEPVEQVEVYRIRLAYDDLSQDNLSINYTMKDGSTIALTEDGNKLTTTNASGEEVTINYTVTSTTDASGTTTYTINTTDDYAAAGLSFDTATGILSTESGESVPNIKVMDQATWEEADYAVDDNHIYFISDAGELVLSNDINSRLISEGAELSVTYDKTGFVDGELRPEMYYDCVDKSDPDEENWIQYKKEDQDIEYRISANQTLAVNTQASDYFDSSLYRDMNELVNTIESVTAAQEKVDRIEAMMKESQYSDDASQAYLADWLTAANRELDFVQDYMQSLFEKDLANVDDYLSDINLATTDEGSKMERLKLTKERMLTQKTTLKSLISTNEDRELSDILIDYTASYQAYEAALTAASKASSVSLLNYI